MLFVEMFIYNVYTWICMHYFHNYQKNKFFLRLAKTCCYGYNNMLDIHVLIWLFCYTQNMHSSSDYWLLLYIVQFALDSKIGHLEWFITLNTNYMWFHTCEYCVHVVIWFQNRHLCKQAIDELIYVLNRATKMFTELSQTIIINNYNYL